MSSCGPRRRRDGAALVARPGRPRGGAVAPAGASAVVQLVDAALVAAALERGGEKGAQGVEGGAVRPILIL